MGIIINLLVSALAVIISSYVLPGVRVDSFVTALIVAVVLAVLNAFLKPVLTVLSLPLTVLTLGLFLFVINAIIVILADKLISGFHVDGWLWAIIFSLILTVVNSLLGSIVK